MKLARWPSTRLPCHRPRLPSPRLLPPRRVPSGRVTAKDDASMQQLYESFDASALELMLRHGVQPSQLSRRVTQALEDASADLLPLAVLYCDSYGGYGLSAKFRDFIERQVDVADYRGRFFQPEHRVLGAELLDPFGHALAQEWPYITQLLIAYFSPQGAVCCRHMQSALQLARRLKELDQASAILIRIAAATAPGEDQRPSLFGIKAWTSTYSMDHLSSELKTHEYENRFRYHDAAGQQEHLLSHAALEQMRKDAEAVISKAAADKAAFQAQVVGVPFGDAMLETARDMRRNEPSWWEERRGYDLSFADAVAKLGERHEDIWLSQRNFSKAFMQHLVRCPEHVSQLLQTEGAPAGADVELELALCAANSCYCNLAVAFIPRLSEWDVHEYDGLETVHFL